MEKDGKRFLTVEDVAKMAGVVTSYIRRLLSQGVIKGVKVGGDGRRGTWLVSENDARQWVENRKRE